MLHGRFDDSSDPPQTTMKPQAIVRSVLVDPGDKPGLAQRDTGDYLGYVDKAAGQERLDELTAELVVQQKKLWAESKQSLLLVLQGLDTAGKDGTIRHVLTGLNPHGFRIVSFSAPTHTELGHDYLWRVHAHCPARGEIGVFDRSHYEDVVTVGVHRLEPKSVWSKRPHHICEFERMLTDEGTTIVKVFLHISKDEQRERLQARLDDSQKAWKFQPGDLNDRNLWDHNIKAYEDVIEKTSTAWAPWHVVPADHKWVRNVAVAELLVHTLKAMNPEFPRPDPNLEGFHVE